MYHRNKLWWLRRLQPLLKKPTDCQVKTSCFLKEVIDGTQPCVFWYLWLQWEVTNNSEPATYTYAAECACHWRSSAAGRRDSRAVCNFSSGRWSVWTTHNEPLKENERWKDQWGLETWCTWLRGNMIETWLYHWTRWGTVTMKQLIRQWNWQW